MSTRTSTFGWAFWVRWVVATVIGWVVGMFGAIILSNLVVNLVYHKETNLIVGLCAGAGVALSQKIAMRRQITLSQAWVWGATIGIGIPDVVAVILNELSPGTGNAWLTPLLIAGGAICGLLQIPALRAHASKVYWWVLATTVSWSLAWFISHFAGTAGFLAGGVALGLVSCGVFLWLRNPQAVAQAA